MLQNLSLEQKLIALNATFLAGVFVFALLLITKNRSVTAEPPVEEISAIINGSTADIQNNVTFEDPAPKFGKEPIFDTLLSLPPGRRGGPGPPPPGPPGGGGP
ncbi:MAG: hypothetical protein SFY68_11300, partial [Candidatus Sumerlaeia bacterium]|nr:hypothetical protein [Candidatus Sumerlaeia bacterium]